MAPIWWTPEDTVTTRPVTFGSRRFVSAKWPRWLVPNCSSKPSAVRASGGIITPALLISRSMSPCQTEANRRTESRLARSSTRTAVAPGMVAAAASPFAWSRTARTTWAPALATAAAAVRPMPLLAPVTITVLPDISGMSAAEKAAMADPRDRRGSSAGWSECSAPVVDSGRPARRASAGGVEPADRGAVAGAAERLKLIVPGGAEQPLQLLLEHRGAVGTEREDGAELVLGHQDVAVGAGSCGKDTETRRVAVADGVAAGR